MSSGMAAGAAGGAASGAATQGITQQLMQGMMQNAAQTPMQGQNAQAGGMQFPAWLDPSIFMPAAAPTGAGAMQAAQNTSKQYGYG